MSSWLGCPRRSLIESSCDSPETPLERRPEIVGGMNSARRNEELPTPRPDTPPPLAQDLERQEEMSIPEPRERRQPSVEIARHEPLPQRESPESE
jgi:hypothetical protein